MAVIPGGLEAVPEALPVAPQQPVEDAREDAVQTQRLHVRHVPHAQQHGAHVRAHDVDHLGDAVT